MKFLLALFFLSSSHSAFAEEGLFENNVPAGIQSIWDATIFVKLFREARGCTAFLAGKEKRGDRNVLFYFSAGHCLVDAAGLQEGQSTADADLLGRLVVGEYLNTKVDLRVPGYWNTLTGDPLPHALKPIWAWARSVGENSDDRQDFSVIAFETQDAVDDMQPVRLGAAARASLYGQRHYLVGFPATSFRLAPEQRVPVANWETMSKRWSTGPFVQVTRLERYTWFIPSDADAMGGNSGSPVILESGEVVGILSSGHAGSSNPNNEFSYLGTDGRAAYNTLLFLPKSMVELRDQAVRKFHEVMP